MCIIINSLDYCFTFIFKVVNILQIIKILLLNYQLSALVSVSSDEARRAVAVNSNSN